MKILESKQLSDRMFLNIKSRNLFPNSDNRYHNLMMTPDGWFKNQLDFKKHFFFIRIFPDSFSLEWHSMHSDSKYSRKEHTQFFFSNSFVYIPPKTICTTSSDSFVFVSVRSTRVALVYSHFDTVLFQCFPSGKLAYHRSNFAVKMRCHFAKMASHFRR